MTIVNQFDVGEQGCGSEAKPAGEGTATPTPDQRATYGASSYRIGSPRACRTRRTSRSSPPHLLLSPLPSYSRSSMPLRHRPQVGLQWAGRFSGFHDLVRDRSATFADVLATTAGKQDPDRGADGLGGIQ